MISHDCQALFKADLVTLIKKMGQQHDGQVLR